MEKVRASAPPHIRTLSLRNFRGFKKASDVQLRPLTFLVGQNSAGKSSLVDAILLIAQSRVGPGLGLGGPRWSGPLVDLGSFTDTVHAHNERLKIEVGFRYVPSLVPSRWSNVKQRRRPDLSELAITYTISAPKAHPNGIISRIVVADVRTEIEVVLDLRAVPVLRLLDQEIRWGAHRRYTAMNRWSSDQIMQGPLDGRKLPRGHASAWRRLRDFFGSDDWSLLLGETQRVSSGRSRPRRWYPKEDHTQPFRGIFREPELFEGVDPSLLQRTGRDRTLYPLGSRRKPRMPSLRQVMSDLDIARDVKSAELSVYHSTIKLTDSVSGIEASLIDVGYGASQVLPVIHACLSGAGGPLFIEQPEIHLHPKAQGVMADLIGRTSLHRQVIVETHSVHVINRARILVAEGVVDSRDVVINFVERRPKGTCVHQIGLTERGAFDGEWPRGFFDERYQDTMKLLAMKDSD